MAFKGTLVRWNGDKGFGFVRCDMDQKEYLGFGEQWNQKPT